MPDITLLTPYTGIKENITCECKKCQNIWITKADNIKSKKSCPKCGREKMNKAKWKDHKFFLQQLEERHINAEPLEEYKGSHNKITMKCLLCDKIWQTTPHALYSGLECPFCRASKGEKRIQIYLEEHNITYVYQHRFPECKHIKPLPFDFYLIDYNICIEYDGSQHFRATAFGGCSQEEAEKALQDTQYRDQIKTQYCKDNNITLIRIAYTEFTDIEAILSEKIIN